MSLRVNSEVNYTRIIANVAPVTHNILGVIPSKGTIPIAKSIAATITSTPTTTTGTDNKKVVFCSVDTDTIDMEVGDYIYAADVVRKIEHMSRKQIIVQFPFPANFAAIALKVIKPGKYKILTAKCTGSTDAVLNEAKLQAGMTVARDNEMGLEPVSYDCSAASNEITFDVSE